MNEMTPKSAKAKPLALSKTRLHGGVWEGLLTGAAKTAPALTLRHNDRLVDGVTLKEGPDKGTWIVRAAIPAEMIADGMQVFTFCLEDTGEVLDSFALIAGAGLADDIRAEMALLRSELDMLKRAFRKHCHDTA
jgi:hypothetical protein